MENVWGRMETEIHKLNPHTLEQLQKSIKTIWKNVIIRDYCEKLVEFMKNKMQELLNKNGEKINY